MNWALLKQYVTQGKVFRGATDKVTLASGKYLNLRLLCPSASGKTVYPLDIRVQADEVIWGQTRTNGTLTGTPTGATAVGLMVGLTSTPQGTLSWSIDGTLPYGGNLYEAGRGGVQRYVDYSEEQAAEAESLAMILAAGNAVVFGYGPAAATLGISVAVDWMEQ